MGFLHYWLGVCFWFTYLRLTMYIDIDEFKDFICCVESMILQPDETTRTFATQVCEKYTQQILDYERELLQSQKG